MLAVRSDVEVIRIECLHHVIGGLGLASAVHSGGELELTNWLFPEASRLAFSSLMAPTDAFDVWLSAGEDSAS